MNIKAIIELITQKFPGTILAHQFKENTSTHFIEVRPKSLYDSKEFKVFIQKIYSDFVNLQTEDDLCFISEESPIKMKNATPYYGIYSNEILVNVNSSCTFPAHINRTISNKNDKTFDENYWSNCLAA